MQLLKGEQLKGFEVDAFEISFLQLIDLNRDNVLCLYPAKELSVNEFQEAINDNKYFLYLGTRLFAEPKRNTTARIFKVVEGYQDIEWGEYDYNTPEQRRLVNELAEMVRSHAGVVSSYVEVITR